MDGAQTVPKPQGKSSGSGLQQQRPAMASTTEAPAPDSSLDATEATRDAKPIQPAASTLRRDSNTKDGHSAAPEPTLTAVDPLSRQILRRTQTQVVASQKLRSAGPDLGNDFDITSGPAAPDIASQPRRSIDPPRGDSFPTTKEKKKGVSFLSRLMNNKRKDSITQSDADDESDMGEKRTEGMDAHVFSQPLGFIPKFPEPPKYIKVRSHNKKERDFNRLFFAQELQWDQDQGSKPATTPVDTNSPSYKASGRPIWTIEFSNDGRYLAAGGNDKTVRVWEVISSLEQRETFDKDEEIRPTGGEERGQRLEAPVFQGKPIRIYEGHTSDVLDLSWSKNNFLLSSSMDKTVRLWHTSRDECLCAFKHSDFVTSISFHPKDDRFFLAGSLDSRLRLWSIPDKSVAFFTILPDLITSVAFTPDGKTAIAGCLTGLCLFYETEGLKYTTQIHVRSTHGRNAKGSKITGIRSLTIPPNSPNGETKLLITSNDSRIRLYNFRDKALEMKFRGNVNGSSQIHARLSDDARYVICGSEDRKAYIWSTSPGEEDKKDKRPVEYFEAHKSIVTAAVIAPTGTKQLLSQSSDPLFDLCNPPKVTLTSRNDSKASSRPPTEAGTLNSDTASSAPPETPISDLPPSEPIQSESWNAKSGHPNGNILVTADYQGQIKVFRQDCAYSKRRNESWETGSTFSKRVNTSIFARTSTFSSRNHSQNRRDSGSFVQNQPSDRILSWRNSIGSSNASLDSSIRNGSLRSATHPPSWRTRSTSPRKASLTHLSHRASETAIEPPTPTISKYSTKTSSVGTGSPAPSIHHAKTFANGSSAPGTEARSAPRVIVSPEDPMLIQTGGQSMAFYNTENWQTPASAGHEDEHYDKTHLAPLEKEMSKLSTLSSEEDSSLGEDDDGTDAPICKKCGGGKFKVSGMRGIGKGRRAVCERCGTDAPV